jgi:hypothetical protein
MKLFAMPSKVVVAYIVTVVAVLPVTTVLADDQDLQETLQRMEAMLQQQQAELAAQRRELAEQRELIRQLQIGRPPAAGAPAPEPVVQPPLAAPVVATDTGEPAAEQAPGESGKEQALAELSRREREGTASPPVSAQAALKEDPSNTTYDLDFPGAWHLPGSTAAMKIAGFVNFALVNSYDPMLISDRFIVGSIPAEGQNVPGAKSGTDVTASQTRINYEVREETRHGTLRAFVEADFEGDGDTFRLRHAFGQYRWALAGKTWSTLMDLESQPEEVDFEGINGMVLSRQPQIRLFPQFGKSMSFKAAVEDPRTDVVNGVGARGRADLIVSVDRVPLGALGDWNSRVAVILRDLEADQTTPGPDEGGGADAVGWGITTSGRKPMSWWGEDDYLLWQVTYGEGIGRYLNDLNTVGGGDAVFDPEGELQPLPVLAGYLSYGHAWPKDFWFLKAWPGVMRSNFTVSWVDIDTFDYQAGEDYDRTLRASTNLIYLPTRNLRLGAELLWGERKNRDGSKGTAVQLQISARYNF